MTPAYNAAVHMYSFLQRSQTTLNNNNKNISNYLTSHLTDRHAPTAIGHKLCTTTSTLVEGTVVVGRSLYHMTRGTIAEVIAVLCRNCNYVRFSISS